MAHVSCLRSHYTAAANPMSSKITILTLSIFLLAPACSSDAQQRAKVARIGVLCEGNCESPLYNALREGLRRLGYIEGHNILIEKRAMEGRQERLPDFVADLVRLKVEVILAAGSMELSQAVKRATRTTPTVFVTAEDPVSAGLVTSFARPGNNLTGFTSLNAELDGKRLALLREVMPRIKRVAVLSNPADPATAAMWRVTEPTARSLNIQLQRLEIRGPGDLDSAIGTATNRGAEALAVLTSPIFFPYLQRIADLAAKKRLPTVSAWRQLTEVGGIMSYGVDISELFGRAAIYVDKILKGARPADMPVERPVKVQLIINLKAAKEIGLTIPPEVLQRADKVIR
jgi:putative ABC transport system substrate-binding protein